MEEPPTPIFGHVRGKFCRKLTEFRFVRIMAVGAKQIELIAVPLPDPPSVKAQFPVTVDSTMALAA